MPTRKASSALFTRIGEVALKEFGRPDLYVAQPPTLLALFGDAHLELLQRLEEDRLDNPASVNNLIEISRVIDCIQVHPGIISTPLDNPSHRFLSDVFPNLVGNVKFLPAPLSEEEKQQYEEALATLYEKPKYKKTSTYMNYCILRAEVEKQEVAVLEMLKKLQGLAASSERDILQTEFDAAKQLCTEKRQALEAFDRAYDFSAAEDTVDKAERGMDEIPASVRSTLDSMELFSIQDPASKTTHIGCSFFPSRLAEDSWTPLKLTREDIAHGKDENQNAPADPNEIDDSQIDFIELEVQTLVCNRDWLWQALFENRQWNWDRLFPPVSTGSEEWGAEDLIPAYIYALIFARNLVIRLQTSLPPPADPSALSAQIMPSLLMRSFIPSISSLQLQGVAIAQPNVLENAASLAEGSIATSTSIEAEFNEPVAIARIKGQFHPNLERMNLAEIWGLGIIRGLAASGSVVDEQGRGIYQASVFLNGDAGQRHVTTGQDGSFIFPTLPAGEYHLRVEKYGFTQVDSSITIPQSAPQTIRISQAAQCRVLVRMQLEDGRPFNGAVKVLIQTPEGQRLESMDQRADALFALPPGDVTISVTSPEAERVSPASVPVLVPADCSELPTLTFTISPASILQYPGVQLLGIICRKVPRSPNPEGQ